MKMLHLAHKTHRLIRLKYLCSILHILSTMMSSLFREASKLNNNGILAIVGKGSYNDAVDSLRRSLRLMKHVSELRIQTAQALTPVVLQAKATPQHSSNISSPLHIHIQRIQIIDGGDDDPALLESNNSIVFGQAFLIDASTNIDDDDSLLRGDVDLNFCICCVLFNLALVHHLTASFNARGMMKAEKLYRLATELLIVVSNDTFPTTHSIDAVVMKLASIVNRSALRYCLMGDSSVQVDLMDQAASLIQGTSPDLRTSLFQDPAILRILAFVLLQKFPVFAVAA